MTMSKTLANIDDRILIENILSSKVVIPVRAPRGTNLHCQGWTQEAALRMLLNNLDPEVAENPKELIVYGGSGKAARNWQCLQALVKSLINLKMMRHYLFSLGNQ